MTKTTILIAFLALFSVSVFSQNIGINTTGASAASTNLLEVLQPAAATTDLTTSIYAAHPGAVAAGTGYALQAIKTGASLNNIAAYLSASGGTNNYGLIVAAGNVGIGTTAPSSLLTIQAAGAGAGQDAGQIVIRDASATAKQFGLGWYTAGDYAWMQTANWGTAYKNLSIQPSGGNVGIGTTNPESILHVLQGSVGTVTSPMATFTTETNTDGDGIAILGSENKSIGLKFGAPIDNDAGRIMYYNSTHSTPNAMAFFTAGSEFMRITNSGKVGIGTSSPAENLHIYSTNNGGLGINIDAQGTGTNQQAYVNFVTSGDGTKVLGNASVLGWSLYARGNAFNSPSTEQNSMGLSYWNGTTWNPLMYWDKIGKVGIGTTAPNTSLDVNGGVAWREASLSLSNGSNNDIAIGNNSFINISGPTASFTITGLAGGTSGKIVTLYNSTSQQMTIANNSGSSSVGNKILTLTGSNIISSAANSVIQLQYSSTASMWLVISGQNLPGGSCASVQTFTASGTWTKPTCGSMARIQCWGGGASGCRNGASWAGTGGGGGGAYNEIWIPLSSLGATETVTIGAGGAAVTTNGTGGYSGGTTSFGTSLYAYGGAGGCGSGAGGGPLSAGGYPTPGRPLLRSAYDFTGAQWASQGEGSFPNIGGIFHGGPGGNNGSVPGGGSLYGGGGGGATGAGTGGGESLYGGNGGGGNTDGTQPGGGGGGSMNGTNSGKGGDGQCVITVW